MQSLAMRVCVGMDMNTVPSKDSPLSTGMVKGTTIAVEQEAGRHVDTTVSYHHIFQRKRS